MDMDCTWEARNYAAWRLPTLNRSATIAVLSNPL